MTESAKFSVVIPVYNEERRLPKTFGALLEMRSWLAENRVEVVFVNDGSTDTTVQKIQEFSKSFPVAILGHEMNRGKGSAVRAGMLAARGAYCFLIDADMSTPLSELEKFLPHLASEGHPVLIGTRKAKGARVTKAQPWYRRKMGQLYTFLARNILKLPVSDFTCGFKCFRRDAALAIAATSRIDRWSYDAEILYLAARKGFEIKEVPVTWHNDEATSVRLFKDTIRAFLDLIKIRFGR